MSSNHWIREGAVSTIGRDLDKNFRPINILVFRNGDMYDSGSEVSVTRRQFPSWLSFLDYLTEKLRLSEGAVHAVYTMLGEEVRTFQELERGRWYVGAHGKFRQAAYGSKVPRQWKAAVGDGLRDPKSISSEESLEMYLRRRGYKPVIGDVWDDSQFDLTKSDGLFSSPPTRKRASQEQRVAPSRTRSAENGIGGGRSTRNGTAHRSKTEESIRHAGAKATVGIIHQARSLPTRLPSRMTTQFVVGSGRTNAHYTDGARSISQYQAHDHDQGKPNDRPGTATLSSRVSHGRSLASEATRRAMQWNPRPVTRETGRAPTPAPPPKPLLHEDEDSSMYKPVDPKVAKLYEDRAYQFYERQKELELKRELLERAAKRLSGAENPYARKSHTPPSTRSRQPLQTTTPFRLPPYRLPPTEHRRSVHTTSHSTSFGVNGGRQMSSSRNTTAPRHPTHSVGRHHEKSPRWVEEASGAVERLSRKVSSLSRRISDV